MISIVAGTDDIYSIAPPILHGPSYAANEYGRGSPQGDQATKCFAQVGSESGSSYGSNVSHDSGSPTGTPILPYSPYSLALAPRSVVRYLVAAAASQVNRWDRPSNGSFASASAAAGGMRCARRRWEPVQTPLISAHAALAVEWPCGTAGAEGYGEG